jgi:hypothetical protein
MQLITKNSIYNRFHGLTQISLSKLLFEEETYKIIGTCDSYKSLGAGFWNLFI